MVTCSFVRVVYTPPQNPSGASRRRSIASRMTAGPAAISARLGRSSLSFEAAPAGAATRISAAGQMTHTRTVTLGQCGTRSELPANYDDSQASGTSTVAQNAAAIHAAAPEAASTNTRLRVPSMNTPALPHAIPAAVSTAWKAMPVASACWSPTP